MTLTYGAGIHEKIHRAQQGVDVSAEISLMNQTRNRLTLRPIPIIDVSVSFVVTSVAFLLYVYRYTIGSTRL